MNPARDDAAVVIGIDVGTTAVKVTAFGVGTPTRASAEREYPMHQPRPGYEEQDPDQMMTAVLEALVECATGLAGREVLAIGLSSAMHGLIGLDADRRPVTPLVTWADSRALHEVNLLRGSGIASAARSGAPVHSMTPLAKIRWFVDHEPETVARVRWWVGLKDYLIQTLTGELVAERSCASGTGLLSLASGDWDPDLVELAGTTLDTLPPVHSTTAHLALLPEVASRAGLPEGLPVVLGAGDGPLGNLGVGALRPGVAGLSLGTSGAIRMVVPRPPTENDGSLFCYALTDDAWVVGAAISNGGMVARWAGQNFLRDIVGDAADPDERLLDLVATIEPGSEGLLMIPYLMGERAPLWDPSISGAYLGVRRQHTAAHFARAAIEGVGLQLGTLLQRLDAVHRVDEVRATGGTFRSTVWRDIVGACLDRPLVVVDSAEGSGLGAAALALFAIGRAGTLEAALALVSARASGDASPAPYRAPADVVATYVAGRRAVSRLLDALAPVGAVMAPRSSAPAVRVDTHDDATADR
ncbi:MAG TPA: gluconokinase [Propionibacteriaceae bacterium]|nr:gluconokinase [Propionibacteriaceae bacterium]